MTVGRRQYNEAEMMQMQQDAEIRVREMQNRARRTLEEANNSGGIAPPPSQTRNRNWSQNPNMFRQRNGRRGGSQNSRTPAPEPEVPPEETAVPEPEPVEEAATEAAAEEAAPKKSGTIVGDIMDALGLDEDYLLIIGLLLILVNQRADTTLILALAYLLI